MQRFISTCSSCVGSAFTGSSGVVKKFHFDALVDHFVEQVVQPVRDAVQIDGARLQHLPPRERQQLSCQSRSAIRLLANSFESLRHVGIVAAVFKPDFRPSQNRADNVGEVVRHAAGELANRLEFLRLPQLPLERAQFGHVLRDHFVCVGIVVGRKPPQVQPNGENSAVAAFPFHFRAMQLAELAARRHQPRIVFREAK